MAHKYLILIPCDICIRVPAVHVARCGLLVCRVCWHEETLACEEALRTRRGGRR
jgi:hypothetical protein